LHFRKIKKMATQFLPTQGRAKEPEGIKLYPCKQISVEYIETPFTTIIGRREIENHEIQKLIVPIFRSEVVSEEDVKKAMESSFFENWHYKMDANEKMVSTTIVFQLVMKDSDGSVCMIKLDANCYVAKPYFDWYDTNKELRGPFLDSWVIASITLLRGPSKAILILLQLNDDVNDLYVLMTSQPRLAVAQPNYCAIPSGDFNDEGMFLCNDVELGFDICETDVVDLTDMVFGSGAYPSCGGIDEEVSLLYHYRIISTTAHRNPNVMIVPISQMWKRTPDGRSLSALHLYKRLKHTGVLK